MQPIKIAVVDDDAQFLRDMTGYLQQCRQYISQPLDICTFNNPEEFWMEFARAPHYIVFLDILFPSANGIDLSRQVHARHAETLIVFMTVSPDFAMHGYGVNAIDYVLKPVDLAKIRHMLEKCLNERRPKPEKFVTFKVGLEMRRFSANTILYLASNNRHVHIHRREGSVVFFGKLTPLAKLLPAEFVQIYQSFIVNLHHVVSLKSHTLLLDDGQTLPVSRSFRKKAADAFFPSSSTSLKGRTIPRPCKASIYGSVGSTRWRKTVSCELEERWWSCTLSTFGRYRSGTLPHLPYSVLGFLNLRMKVGQLLNQLDQSVHCLSLVISFCADLDCGIFL